MPFRQVPLWGGRSGSSRGLGPPSDTVSTVSGALSLDPGQYVLVGKLNLSNQAGPPPGEISVMCELHRDAEVLDFAGAFVSTGREVPLTLASTTVVQDGPSSISIVCATDTSGSEATAFAVQQIATQVMSAQLVTP